MISTAKIVPPPRHAEPIHAPRRQLAKQVSVFLFSISTERDGRAEDGDREGGDWLPSRRIVSAARDTFAEACDLHNLATSTARLPIIVARWAKGIHNHR